jgi:hypothetical protein
MSWVLSQDIRPSHVKFVLLAVADCSNEKGFAWPSVEAIAAKTSQDRKTVIAALAQLDQMRLIRDTGERRGATMQVKVLQIVGLPSAECHYVYRLDEPNTGEFYIGLRSCLGDPRDDDYMGSGKWPFLMQKAGISLTKTIIREFPSREEAAAEEVRLIQEKSKDSRLRNCLRKESLPRNSPVDGFKQYRPRKETVPPTEVNSTADGTRNHQEPSRTITEPSCDGFELAWSAYPKREGDNPKKQALNAWNARRKEGHTAEELRQGAERYRVYCQTRGEIGTSFVMQAKRFFGPDKPFLNSWQAQSRKPARTVDDYRKNLMGTHEQPDAIDSTAKRLD